MNEIADHNWEITGEEVKHIQVLRHQVGDTITINTAIYEIAEIRKHSIIVKRVATAPKQGEPNLSLTLFMAMLKQDKMDWVVQKAVELGCKEITPFFSQNVIVKLDEVGKKKRKEKLQKIADEACKQCGRTDTVTVHDFITLKEMLSLISAFPLTIFAYEKETKPLRKVLQKEVLNHQALACIVGPEGGFSEPEATLLRQCENVATVSLGSRILRAETAALQLTSVIMYEGGDVE